MSAPAAACSYLVLAPRIKVLDRSGSNWTPYILQSLNAVGRQDVSDFVSRPIPNYRSAFLELSHWTAALKAMV